MRAVVERLRAHARVLRGVVSKISGAQRQSEAISGVVSAISGNQRQSEAIRGNQRQSEAISGVVSAISGGTRWHSVALRVPLGEARGLGRLLRADGLRQISKGGWVRQIEIRARIVLEDPRYDRVLCQIVVRATGKRIEAHEVVEVGDAPALPVVEQLLMTRR